MFPYPTIFFLLQSTGDISSKAGGAAGKAPLPTIPDEQDIYQEVTEG